MKDTVKIQVNEKALLKNLRYAFKDSMKVFSELMQNARRAGASYIKIDYDEAAGKLQVEDDGCGISDFQDLFSVASSGWDENTQESEKPFGMGFLSTLYQAKEITIYSKGKMLNFKTEDALDFADLKVIESADIRQDKTVLVFEGFNKVSDKLSCYTNLQMSMIELATCFPISVIFNGQFLSNHLSLNEIQKSEKLSKFLYDIPCGKAFVPCYETSGFCSGNFALIYQGFYIGGTKSDASERGNIVFVDSGAFPVQMPDRDAFIDADSVKDEIKKQLFQHVFKVVIDEYKEKLTPSQFLESWYSSMKMFGYFEPLMDMDIIPNNWVDTITEMAHCEHPYDSNCESYRGANITRQEIESGEVKIVILPPQDNGNWEHSSALWQIIGKLGWYVFNQSVNSPDFDKEASFLKSHWLTKHLINLNEVVTSRNLGIPEVEVEVLLDAGGNIQTESLYNNYDTINGVKLCDEIFVGVKVNGEYVISEKVNDLPFFYDGYIVLTRDALNGRVGHYEHPSSWLEDMMLMTSAYLSDDVTDDESLADDVSGYASLLSTMKENADAVSILKDSLSNACLGLIKNSVKGKSFTITFDDEGGYQVAEIVAN